MAPSFTLWVAIYNGGISFKDFRAFGVYPGLNNFSRLIYITASRYSAVRISFLNTLFISKFIGLIKRNLATLMWPTGLRIQITRFIS